MRWRRGTLHLRNARLAGRHRQLSLLALLAHLPALSCSRAALTRLAGVVAVDSRRSYLWRPPLESRHAAACVHVGRAGDSVQHRMARTLLSALLITISQHALVGGAIVLKIAPASGNPQTIAPSLGSTPVASCWSSSGAGPLYVRHTYFIALPLESWSCDFAFRSSKR